MIRRLGPLVVMLALLLLLGGGAWLSLRGAGSGASGADDSGMDAGGDVDAADPVAGTGNAGRRRVRAPSPADPAAHSQGAGGSAADVARTAESRNAGAGGDAAVDGEHTLGNAAASSGDAPPESPAPRARGRVLDADGNPLVGARVLAVRVGSGWHGARSGEDGSFDSEVPQGDGALELRVRMPGHQIAIVPWSGEELADVDVRLERQSAPPVPGRVLGYATDPDGHPITGRVLVTGYDAMWDHQAVWSIADDGGSFVLEGVAPGHWTLRLSGAPQEHTVDAIVPDGGETRAHLRGGAEPWPGELDEATFRRLHSEISRRMTRFRSDATVPADERESNEWQVVMSMQGLESRWRGVAPAREVFVTGLPTPDHAYLTAAATRGPGHRWRVPIREGTARFSALTHEVWSLSVEVPGDVVGSALDLIVAAGEGVQRVAWNAASGGDE